MEKLKKINAVKFILEIVLFTVLYRSFEIAGMKKYAIIVVMLCVYFFLSRKKYWKPELLYVGIPLIIYIVIGGISGIFHGSYQFDTIKIILYGVIAFGAAFLLCIYYGEDYGRIIDAQFFGCCIVYLSLTIVYMVTRMSRVESTFGFVFGLFLLYYVYQKRWRMAALSAVFTYLADKRIVLLAVVVCLFIMALLCLFRLNKKLILFGWSAVVLCVFLYIYLIASGTLEAFCWGANINTNGRVEMFGRMISEFSNTYIGNGLGVVEKTLECWNVKEFANLHNDLLKFYIELGLAGTFIYLLSYVIMFEWIQKTFGNSRMCFVFIVCIYTMILYATDNISVYVMYLFPMYSMFFAALSTKHFFGSVGEKND